MSHHLTSNPFFGDHHHTFALFALVSKYLVTSLTQHVSFGQLLLYSYQHGSSFPLLLLLSIPIILPILLSISIVIPSIFDRRIIILLIFSFISVRLDLVKLR